MSRARLAVLAALLTPMAFGAAQQQDPGPCDPVLIDLTELIPQPEPPPPPQPECRSLVMAVAVGTDEAGQAATRVVFLSPAGYAPVLVVLDPDTGFPGETLDLGLASIDCLSASDGGQSVFVVSGGILYTYLPVLDLGVLSLQLLSSVVVGPVDDVIGRPGTSDAVVIGDDVTIVDGGTGTVIDSVFLGGDPFAAAFLSDPSMLVVAQKDGQIALVKLDPLGVIGTKPIGPDLGGVAVCEPETGDSDIIFVSDQATNTITALDASTMTVVDVVDATSPGGIETGETGPASVDLAFVMEERFISVLDCKQDNPTYLKVLVQIVRTGKATTVVMGPPGTDTSTFVGEETRTEVLVLNPGCITNAPQVDSISPLAGPPGTIVTVTGQLTAVNFIVELDGIPLAYVTPLTLTASEATFEMPLGIAAGLAVTVSATESSEQAVETGNYLRSPPREFQTLDVASAIEALIVELQAIADDPATPNAVRQQILKAIDQLQKALAQLAKGHIDEAFKHFGEALEKLFKAIEKGGQLGRLPSRLVEIAQFLLFQKLAALTATLGAGNPLLANPQVLFDIGRGSLLSGDLESALDAFADALEDLDDAIDSALIFQPDEALETIAPLVMSLLQASWRIDEAWVAISKTDPEAAAVLLDVNDRLVGSNRNLANSVIGDFGQGEIEKGFAGVKKILKELEETPEPVRGEISTEIVHASLGFAQDLVGRAGVKVGSFESRILKALERLSKTSQLLLQKDFLGAVQELLKAIEDLIDGLRHFFIKLEQESCSVKIKLEQPNPICEGESITFKDTVEVHPPNCPHLLIRGGSIWSKSFQKHLRLFHLNLNAGTGDGECGTWDGKDKEGNSVTGTVEVVCGIICVSTCAPPSIAIAIKQLEIVPDGDCTIKPANKTICVGEDVKIELVVCQNGQPVKVPEAQTNVQVVPASLGSVSGSTFTGGAAGSGTIVATDIKTGKTCQTRIDIVDEKPQVIVHNEGQVCEGGFFDFDLVACKDGVVQPIQDDKAKWEILDPNGIATLDPNTGVVRVNGIGTITVISRFGLGPNDPTPLSQQLEVSGAEFDTLEWALPPLMLYCQESTKQFSVIGFIISALSCGAEPVPGVDLEISSDPNDLSFITLQSQATVSSNPSVGVTDDNGTVAWSATAESDKSLSFLGTMVRAKAGQLELYAPTTLANATVKFGDPLSDFDLCVGDTAPVTVDYDPPSPLEIKFQFPVGSFFAITGVPDIVVGTAPLSFTVEALESSENKTTGIVSDWTDGTCLNTEPLAAYKILLTVNDTATSNDDVVRTKTVNRSTSEVRRYSVPCRAELIGELGGDAQTRTIHISNPDGRLRFGSESSSTTELTLSKTGSPELFTIKGESVSAAFGDAKIQVREDSSSSDYCAEHSVTVFGFDSAQINVASEGAYQVISVGGIAQYSVLAPDQAVTFEASAIIVPEGLDCTVAQIAKLKIGIVQNGTFFRHCWTIKNPVFIEKGPGADAVKALGISTVDVDERGDTEVEVSGVFNDVATGHPGPLYSSAASAVKPPANCAGGGVAKSGDTPSATLGTVFLVSKTIAGTIYQIGKIRYEPTQFEYRDEFITWVVVFDTQSNLVEPLKETDWRLSVDSSGAATQFAQASRPQTSPTRQPKTTGPTLNTVINDPKNRRARFSGTVTLPIP